MDGACYGSDQADERMQKTVWTSRRMDVCIDTWMDGIVHGYRMGCIEVRYDAEVDAWVYVSMSRCLDEKHMVGYKGTL